MAGDCRLGIIIRLFVIILTVSLHNNTLKNVITVGAEILMEPLWDTTFNGSYPCSMQNTVEGRILFRGSTNKDCSLQLSASQESSISVQIPGSHVADEPFFLYIERYGDLGHCLNRYLAVLEQTETCNIILKDDYVTLNLQGNASILLSDVQLMDISSNCPQNNGFEYNKSASNTPTCRNVKWYDEIVLCAPHPWVPMWSQCKFPPNCGAILGYREVIYKACNDNLSRNHTALVAFPIQKVRLDLMENNIIKIQSGAFRQGLENVQRLYLHGNNLTTFNADVFLGLQTDLTISFVQLNLYDNQITELNAELFNILAHLEILVIVENQITLREGMFDGLHDLKYLWIGANMLTTFPKEIFHNLLNLISLELSDNSITHLDTDIFVKLHNLTELWLSYTFNVHTLETGLFRTLQNLQLLDMAGNPFTHLRVDTFTGLQRLQFLILYRNKLYKLDAGLFHDLTNLVLLSLEQNRLTHFPDGIFKRQTHLKTLNLFDNQLTQLDINLFKGLPLNYLALSNNSLTHLEYHQFKDAVNVSFLDLSNNSLEAIPNIEHLTKLQFLDITNNTLLKIFNTSFHALSKNSQIFVSQHEICACYVPSNVNCSAADDRSPYLTCDRLLSDRVLVIVMWMTGLGALSGNAFVLVWRKKETNINVVNSILLQNLAASDLLMGIYMLIIASADIYFGDNFPMQSERWRSGITCRIAGALAIISSEASVFFVTLISIDRLVAVRFPFSDRRLRKHSVRIVATVIWAFSFAIGIVPSVLSGINYKFYDNSHVCIGLPMALTKIYEIETDTSFTYSTLGLRTYYREKVIFTTQLKGLDNGLFFSTAVFLGLNCVCYLIILGCYIEIVRAVKRSSARAGRSKEMQQQIRLTTKVTAIVATDFFCWFPVIVLGILVQTRVVTLPPAVYAWCVTFVLPINSAINPYLYTISEIVSNYRKAARDANKSKSAASQSSEVSKTVSKAVSGSLDNHSELNTNV